MNYIEELFARQGALLRAVSRTGSRRRAEESRGGEVPLPGGGDLGAGGGDGAIFGGGRPYF